MTIPPVKQLLALIALCVVAQGAEYEFEWGAGDSLAPVAEGAVWLYHYGYGSLGRYKLSDIHQGRARIELSARVLEEEVQPAANTRAFVLVLEFPAKRWYRTVDIEPGNFLRDCLPALDALGVLDTANPRSVKRLVLPAPKERRLRFLSPEGSPLARKAIPVSIYVSNHNHCAIHEGLPLGTFATDENGRLVVPAPEMPLYLDLSYWATDGRGFAGQMYASEDGLVVEPGVDVIRLVGSLPGEPWELRLCNQQGKPISKASLVEWVRIHGCGANWGPLGITDDEGFVRITVEPQSLERLAFQDGTGAQRELSAEELTTLWREKKLAVTWLGERH